MEVSLKKCFLKSFLSEQHKNSAKILAKSFEFSLIFEKNRNQKAQRSTILEGGVHTYPLPHLVVKLVDEPSLGSGNVTRNVINGRPLSGNLPFYATREP